MRARPAAPARSVTSRPSQAVRAIFVVASRAAAAPEVTELPVTFEPVDPFGAFGAGATASFDAPEPADDPEPAAPADEPASRSTSPGVMLLGDISESDAPPPESRESPIGTARASTATSRARS